MTIEIHKNRNDLISLNDQEAINKLASGNVEKIVKDIYTELKKTYDLDYSIYEIQQASILMMTRVVTANVENIKHEQIESILGKDINILIDEIVKSVYDTYNINLDNDNFLIRFAFHLKNLIVRLKYNIKINDLQFSGIKNEYPLIYAVSVFISKIITQPDNESEDLNICVMPKWLYGKTMLPLYTEVVEEFTHVEKIDTL